jgi:hypothetical protein
MGTESHRADDPISLSPLGFIRRAIRFCLSLPSNIINIQRSVRRAGRLGKRPVFVLLTGRMGDLVAAEPVIRHMKEPGDYLIWLCRPRYAGVLTFNPFVDEIRFVTSDFEASILMQLFGRQRWINLLLDGTRCNVFGTELKNPNALQVNIQNHYRFGTNTDVFALLGTGAKLNDRPRLYVDQNFDVDAYIDGIFVEARPLLVFHPLSDEFARSWAEDKARAFADWVLQNTPFNVIEVGMNQLLEPGNRVFSIRDRLSLPSQMALIARAKLFVGIDSSFSHIANASAVPSVLLLGCHLGFKTHLPLPINDHDIVVRGPGQTHEIEVLDVTNGLLSLFFKMNTP